jgi:hypothetical protein
MMRSTKLSLFLFILLLPLAALGAPLDRQFGQSPTVIPQVQYMTIVADQVNGKMVTKIEPFNNPRLDRFTQVLWTNNAHVPVRMKFGKGPKCEEVSEIRLRDLDWRLDKTCYVNQKPVPPKGVLQTIFNDPGKYPYEVEFIGENFTESGVITVY